MQGNSTDDIWIRACQALAARADSQDTAPRGRKAKEVLGRTLTFNMEYPVITFKARAIGYKFMFAEAAWILSGDNTVAGIEPWHQSYYQWSDDGVRFFGAPGPRVVDQLQYVAAALRHDRESRRAVMTLWRDNPPLASVDVPCATALQFLVRDNKLHCVAFMRSSDAWLGLPYDIFNFTMIALTVARELDMALRIGMLHLHLGSSHMYLADIARFRGLSHESGYYGQRALELADFAGPGRSPLDLCRRMRDGPAAGTPFSPLVYERYG